MTSARPRPLAWTLVLFVCVASSAPRALHAQDLAGAQAALARYDLADPRTYEALGTLRSIADANGPEAFTARAVRAYAGVDLLVAATLLADEPALERLRATFGAREDGAMRAMLDGELARTPSGALAVAAREARATLAGLSGRFGPHSPRSDAIAVLTVGADEASLRARVHDRFDPVIDSTLELAPEHDDEARRIIAAMHAIAASIRAAQAGDPLLLLLRPRLEATRARLAEVVIADASLADVDAFVTLAPGTLRFGYVPRTRISIEGRPVLESGSPSLPAATTVRLPAELPPVVRPIEGLATDPAIVGAREGRVALRLEGDVPAHLVARVVRSLEGTPLAIDQLAVDTARVAVTFTREDAVAADATRVFLRPGGYAVERRGGRRTDLPRLRVDGHWQFDREGLVRQLPAAGSRAVIANALAPASELFAAALAVAVEGRITVVVP